MTEPELLLRQAVRAVMIDHADRVLLVKLDLPLAGWVVAWVLPGGGIEPGEDPVQALRRELHEETGLADPFIGPVVCRRRKIGGPTAPPGFSGQEETIYLVPCHDFQLAPALSEQELSDEGIVDIRWFSVDELAATTDKVAPPDLIELIERVLEHGGSVDPLVIEVIEPIID